MSHHENPNAGDEHVSIPLEKSENHRQPRQVQQSLTQHLCRVQDCCTLYSTYVRNHTYPCATFPEGSVWRSLCKWQGHNAEEIWEQAPIMWIGERYTDTSLIMRCTSKNVEHRRQKLSSLSLAKVIAWGLSKTWKEHEHWADDEVMDNWPPASKMRRHFPAYQHVFLYWHLFIYHIFFR
jgi:hypothetical protein